MTEGRARSAAVDMIFDREVARAEADFEPSPYIEWLERLREEVQNALTGSVPARERRRWWRR